MTYRVLSSDAHPARLIEHIRKSGCVVRQAETTWRGPLAIVGGGFVHALANLREVKPIASKSESGFLWCIDDLREIEPMPCAVYGDEATFWNGSNLEPQFLTASAQEELGRYLKPTASSVEVESVEIVPDEEVIEQNEGVAPMPPDYGTEAPKPARKIGADTSQMSLF